MQAGINSATRARRPRQPRAGGVALHSWSDASTDASTDDACTGHRRTAISASAGRPRWNCQPSPSARAAGLDLAP